MEPRIIEQPLDFYPHSCCITGRNDGEIIDFGQDNPQLDGHIYFKLSVLEDVAVNLLHMVPERDVNELREAVEHLTELLEEKTERLAAYEVIHPELEPV